MAYDHRKIDDKRKALHCQPSTYKQKFHEFLCIILLESVVQDDQWKSQRGNPLDFKIYNKISHTLAQG